MPRAARLDARGALQHAMGRGIEGTAIFRTQQDREDFLQRLDKAVRRAGCHVLAWALQHNHFHLLMRTGWLPLASVMRQLLTGYAAAFNRRHGRRGHLFQNRYKSILVEEEPHFLELVRYIHLNPFRAGLVRDLAQLDRYPWSGHSALLGHVPRPWQAMDEVLGQFAATRREARRRYRAFVAEGARLGRRPELQGGGLRRSVGGWEGVAALRRGRERWAADERILGSSGFVERMLREATPPLRPIRHASTRRAIALLVQRIATACQINPWEIAGRSRRRPVARARAAVAVVAIRSLGLPAAAVARALGVSQAAVHQGMERGAAELRIRGLDLDRLVREARKQN